MKLKPQQNFNYRITKPSPIHEMSDDQLAKRLYFTVVAIIVLIILGIISVMFFAPKIGGLFEFLTSDEENDISAQITPASPVLVDIPQTTKSETVTIQGYAEPGVTVKLFLNGPEAQSTVADVEGKFTFDNLTLIKGKNILFAKSVSSSNIESESSGSYTINYDDKAPEITIDSPKDDETVRNLDERILVKGKVNERADVRVNGSTAILKSDNSFEILLGVDDGEVEIQVEATDEAGNKSEKTINVKYIKSS